MLMFKKNINGCHLKKMAVIGHRFYKYGSQNGPRLTSKT